MDRAAAWIIAGCLPLLAVLIVDRRLPRISFGSYAVLVAYGPVMIASFVCGVLSRLLAR